MQKFNLTVFQSSRIYIGLIILPFAFLALLILGLKLGSIILGIFISITLPLIFLIYFAIGHLTVFINDAELKFHWKKKYLFNYKEIETIKLSDISTLVIENEQIIRKIKTNSRIVYIGNLKTNAASSFIRELISHTKEANVRIIDSWDELADKGYLKIVFRTTTIIIVLVALLVCAYLLVKGFTIKVLFVLLFIPQMLLYREQMKKKLKAKMH